MNILLIIGLVISLIFNIILVIAIQNSLHKISIYEQWILDFKTDVISTLEHMREIDKQGVFATSVNTEGLFESDDQVGAIFKELMDLIEKLNQKTQ